MSISKEAIEAGARALFAVENCDRRQMLDVESNWHGRLNDENRQEYRVLATAALTAAAPHIQAAALRDEADKMDRRAEQFDTINDNPKDHEYETLVRYGAYAGEARSSAYRLRARADQLEGKTK